MTIECSVPNGNLYHQLTHLRSLPGPLLASPGFRAPGRLQKRGGKDAGAAGWEGRCEMMSPWCDKARVPSWAQCSNGCLYKGRHLKFHPAWGRGSWGSALRRWRIGSWWFWLGCHFSLDVWLLGDGPCFGGTHAHAHKGSTNRFSRFLFGRMCEGTRDRGSVHRSTLVREAALAGDADE